jgi:hypothetical protein
VFWREETRTPFFFPLAVLATDRGYCCTLPILRRDMQSYYYVPVPVAASSAGDLILPSYSYLTLMITEQYLHYEIIYSTYRSGVLQIRHGKQLVFDVDTSCSWYYSLRWSFPARQAQHLICAAAGCELFFSCGRTGGRAHHRITVM